MYVSKQELPRQGLRDTVERGGDKVDIAQVADRMSVAATQAVKLHSYTADEHPARDLVTRQFPKRVGRSL